MNERYPGRVSRVEQPEIVETRLANDYPNRNDSLASPDQVYYQTDKEAATATAAAELGYTRRLPVLSKQGTAIF